jgi:hypothetical protein
MFNSQLSRGEKKSDLYFHHDWVKVPKSPQHTWEHPENLTTGSQGSRGLLVTAWCLTIMSLALCWSLYTLLWFECLGPSRIQVET